ncbi:MAG: hypothetical protein ACQCN3_07175 [Candidatus Bathyarchaeia archaeon]
MRARQLEHAEWKLSVPFSLQLIPFSMLLAINLFLGSGWERLVVELPIIAYLIYDLWYRLIAQKKPYHHPQRWPIGLVVYIILLFAGSIGLNWYGYLVSDLFGNSLVVCFFLMMGSYSYYQYSHNKQLKPDT